MNIANPEDIKAALKKTGQKSDDHFDLAETALLLSGISHSGLSFDRYRNHISRMVESVARRHEELLSAGAEDNLETRLASLKHVLLDQEKYEIAPLHGDIENYDLVRVIDQRKGALVMLSILCVHVGQVQGWDVYGLNMPGHFLVRMDKGGDRLIANPAESFSIMQAPDLRRLVKQSLGEDAELSVGYYEVVSNRSCLIHLQNNIKLRQIEMEEYESALETVRVMNDMAPDEYRLLLDMGVLCARTGRPVEAVTVLESYIEKAPDGPDRYDAEMLLQDIKTGMF